MKINLPENVKYIINVFEKNNYECFIVGGCVRDSLSNVVPNDWDFATNATPKEMLNLFSKYKTFTSGAKHGTVSVVINGKIYEITTYRIDGDYKDNRRPDKVTFTSKLKEDLKRRDFTINAMAYSDETGLIDYFNGVSDLEKGIIRAVGNPEKRFNEDALRILRALRFASVLSFKIEAKTATAIKNNKELLNNIALERIGTELNKTLCGNNIEKILKKYKDVFATIIPELKIMFKFNQNTPHHDKSLWSHTACAVNNIEKEEILRVIMLFHDIGKPLTETVDEKGISHFKGHEALSAEIARKVLKRFNYSREFIKTTVILIEYHDTRFDGNKKHIKRVLSVMGAENFRKLIKIQWADMLAQSNYEREEKEEKLIATEEEFRKILHKKECFSLDELKITGNDIINLNIEEGKNIGIILNILLEEVIDDKIKNNNTDLTKRVKEINFSLKE